MSPIVQRSRLRGSAGSPWRPCNPLSHIQSAAVSMPRGRPVIVVAAVLPLRCHPGIQSDRLPIIRASWFRPAIGVIVALAILVPFTVQVSKTRRQYAALTPLELPGSSHIRLDKENVRVYQDLVRRLARPEVETFLTLPGLNSLYFWTRKDPRLSSMSPIGCIFLTIIARSRFGRHRANVRACWL